MFIRKTFPIVDTKAVENDDRSLVVKISTATEDRSKDVVQPNGVMLDNYMKNPVVAAFHRYDQPAIGQASDIQVDETGITAKVTFAPKGVYGLADTLCELYKAGIQRGWSIGFIAEEWKEKQGGGYEFTKWQLLEFSAVVVPDNPEALTMAKSKGIDTKLIEDEIEKMKEKPVKTMEIDSKENKIIFNMTDGEKKTFEAGEDLMNHFKELHEAYATVKEGRVLSESNRKIVGDAMNQMKEAISALEKLMEATQKSKEPEEKKTEGFMGDLDNVRKQAVKLDQQVGQFLKAIKV